MVLPALLILRRKPPARVTVAIRVQERSCVQGLSEGLKRNVLVAGTLPEQAAHVTVVCKPTLPRSLAWEVLGFRTVQSPVVGTVLAMLFLQKRGTISIRSVSSCFSSTLISGKKVLSLESNPVTALERGAPPFMNPKPPKHTSAFRHPSLTDMLRLSGLGADGEKVVDHRSGNLETATPCQHEFGVDDCGPEAAGFKAKWV